MANLKSQIKRNRQNEAARQRNKMVRTHLKTVRKRFLQAVEAGDKDAATAAYREASKHFDKAAEKGVIHRNNAANKKSKMAKKLQAL